MVARLEATPSAALGSEAPASDRERDNGRDRTTLQRLWPGAVCCILYAVLAMAAYGFGSLGPSQMVGFVPSADSIEQIWWLAWAAHAWPHVQNLFVGQGQNYPYGQNFGVNGSMLALGVAFAPVTKIFGPVVTWNILLRLALAASASSMCLVLRRWVHWWPAAFFGGLLYAICGYAASEYDYLFLIFVPLPPVIFLLLHETLVRQQWPPAWTGTLLGVTCSVQFFIFTEVLAMTAVLAALAIALLIVIFRQSLVQRWRYAVTAFAFSASVASLLLLYPLWFTFAGPQHLNGPPTPATVWAQLFPADALSLFVHGTYPDPQHPSLATGGLLYLGVPLIVALFGFVVLFRKRRVIIFAGGMALIAYVISLGPQLWVDGHKTSIPLPFVVFEHLPGADGFWPSRFALLTALFAAGVFAIGIEELWNRLKRSRHLLKLPPALGVVGRTVVVGAVVVAVTVPLIPRSTRPATATNVPTFFTSTAVDSIPPGSVVLAYPYPDATSSRLLAGFAPSAMLYQAVTGMRFKLIGGYGYFPSPIEREGTSNPALLVPQSVETLFDVTLNGVETPTQRKILSNSNLTNDIRLFLKRFDVQTVIVTHPSAPRQGNWLGHLGDPSPVIGRITSAIGQPVDTGGVTVWFQVRQRLAAVAS